MRKTILCNGCDASYTISFDMDEELYKNSFCPFCGDDLDDVLFEKAISQTVTEIITDSFSLIPYYATTLTTVTLKVAEEAEVSNRIRQEYWFDWR